MNLNVFRTTVLLAILIFSGTGFGKIDSKIFSHIKPRSIGPANMSGRIGDVQAVISNPNIIYVGAATGGVWKSEDRGITWTPIFDGQPASSIGALAIFQKNPNIVWVGTGEANLRNSVGVGRGVFKSIDGGKTWINLGLARTEKISRIVLDPDNPDVAYAAALGTTWGENPQRGVFKTMDGGKTWEKILYVDQKTGAADLAMAPDNPNKLIAAMWEHRRRPWFFTSGGPGSGLFITADGGKNWKKLTSKDGLPGGNLGRIGIAFAVNKPNIVYALVEARKSVLLRSEDGGFTWKTVNNKGSINIRPFYFCDIRVNPRNENIVYKLEVLLWVSEDGGRNFKRLTSMAQAHSDFHAMWIHPDGEYMIVGTDGGINFSFNRGKSWRLVRNLPLGQFYHINCDMELPYNVYGGLQDNGLWKGPSSVLTDWSIYGYYWKKVRGQDGFDIQPDPEDNRFIYTMTQVGDLSYADIKTMHYKNIMPPESDVKLRYNWNAGFAIDPFEPAVIYLGSQFLHRSRDKGCTWEIISPDLTTNDPEKQKQAESGGLTLDVTWAENHTTIMSIAPSPVKKGVIWVGTDDGHVQLTTDAGKTWRLVSRSLTGTKIKSGKVPYGTWVPHVEACKFDPSCAFVVFDDHRRANWTPYVFVTEDYGKTWKDLATNDIDGFIHVIEQDHKNKDLLFLGTEFGFYFSVNRGKEWIKWTSGFPTVPVRDLAVHPRDNDLVIGTHGRSIYILDDISFLREIDDTFSSKEVHLFKPGDAYQLKRSSAYRTRGNDEFKAKNRDFDAVITYYYNIDEHKGEKSKNNAKLKIEILNEKGDVVRELKTRPKKGINRVSWDFRGERELEVPGEVNKMLSTLDNFYYLWPFRSGLNVLPGTYTARLQYGDVEMKRSFTVKFDPRFTYDPEVLKRNISKGREILNWAKIFLNAVHEVKKTRKIAKTVIESVKEDKKLKPELKKKLTEKAKDLEKKLEELSEKTFADFTAQHIPDWDEFISAKIHEIYTMITDSFEPISGAAEIKFKKTEAVVENFLKQYNRLFETDVEDFKKMVKDAGVSLFTPFEPLRLKGK